MYSATDPLGILLPLCNVHWLVEECLYGAFSTEMVVGLCSCSAVHCITEKCSCIGCSILTGLNMTTVCISLHCLHCLPCDGLNIGGKSPRRETSPWKMRKLSDGSMWALIWITWTLNPIIGPILMVAVTQILVIDLWSTMDSRIKMDVIEVHGIIEFVLVLTREFFVSQYTPTFLKHLNFSLSQMPYCNNSDFGSDQIERIPKPQTSLLWFDNSSTS